MPRNRPRGDDGRFVPRADEEPPADNRDRKVCGWCRTTSTSQWRVGPTNGSSRMGTLCNACGINYRRALAKSQGGVLDLDRLSEQMGHTRLSIQKALKRQRKLATAPHHFKRSRTVTRPIDRFTHRAMDRFPISHRPTITTSSHSTLTMLLDDHPSVTDQTRHPIIASSPLDVAVFPQARTPTSTNAAGRYLGMPPVGSVDYSSSALTQSVMVEPQHVDRSTVAAQVVREEDQSRLPPFQAFIGDLERRTSM